MTIGRFLAGIGALIWDPQQHKYLLLKRSEQKDFAAGAWECITGRVDQGEGFEDALHREVREELGIEVRPVFMLGTTHFYRGRQRPENELVGVVYFCLPVSLTGLSLSAEHDESKWVTVDEAYALLTDIHPSENWLRQVIVRAEITKASMPSDLLVFHRREGFELDT
jgi:8-oxo-dGTP diphosphatase